LGLDPPRDALLERINARCQRMFERGLVDEVRRLVAAAPGAKPLEALGYRQTVQLLDGEIDSATALLNTQRDTRRYAKRQMTWFRADPSIEWLPGFGDHPRVQVEACTRVARSFFA
ncbi:MAG: tRNA (adenosine(37)-N6)-dimethylallyltransferase MiaA, partial [Bryobacteraceae bacterium]